MGEGENNSISIEYLIDLLASIKSALSNIDDRNTEIFNILSQVSENITILAELNKREVQDKKIVMLKFETMIREVSNLSNEIKLGNSELLNSNEIINNKIDLKKETIDELNKNLKEINIDVQYLKQKFIDERNTKLFLEQNKIDAIKKEKEKENDEFDEDDENADEENENGRNKKKNLFGKCIDFVVKIHKSVSALYKILILIFGIILLILFGFGFITWNDIVSLITLKFFTSGG